MPGRTSSLSNKCVFWSCSLWPFLQYIHWRIAREPLTYESPFSLILDAEPISRCLLAFNVPFHLCLRVFIFRFLRACRLVSQMELEAGLRVALIPPSSPRRSCTMPIDTRGMPGQENPRSTRQWITRKESKSRAGKWRHMNALTWPMVAFYEKNTSKRVRFKSNQVISPSNLKTLYLRFKYSVHY